MSETDFQPSELPSIVVGLAVLCLIAGIIVMYCRASTIQGSSSMSSSQERGVEGDFVAGYMGTATALCSALLFYAAYLKQSDELRLQRIEFRESRKVAERQEGHLKAQVENLEKQLKEVRLRSDREHLLELISRISTNISDPTDGRDRSNIWHEMAHVFEYACQFAYEKGEAYDQKQQFIAILKAAPRLFSLGGVYSDAKRNNIYPWIKKFIDEENIHIAR